MKWNKNNTDSESTNQWRRFLFSRRLCPHLQLSIVKTNY